MTNHYYIYKLEIGDYFYWGSSKSPRRLNWHKTTCYNPKTIGYKYKVYQKIRQLCPNPKHFYDFISYEVFYDKLDIKTKKYLEQNILQKHKNNPYCLNSNFLIQQQGESRNEYFKRYNDKR